MCSSPYELSYGNSNIQGLDGLGNKLEKFHEFLVVGSPSVWKHSESFVVYYVLVFWECSNSAISCDAGHDTFKEITRSSTHTILAGCGLEHKRSEVQFMPLPSICTHVERVAAGQTSIMKGLCLSCFDSFVRDVVKRIMDTRLPQWLSLRL